MDNWIRVTDRLPNVGESVLIYRKAQTGSEIVPGKGVVAIMSDWITNGIWDGTGWTYQGWPAYDVTHWQPMPAPPEEANHG